ncbi:glycosyltransferase [Salisediminibacterium halotolerans]|uniref:glycosyltransferase n=1 Tax=Salisediminibacterium halotolerans TaxID=517425 RepID=UPI000EB108BA|nr:glycosyltransferase [Salisediminibacterium halotolerans]RLJ75602.1 glycosyl transferase family 1 [Actinophytocola xinjiangensis]RPE89456.1 glycosyl transferase family 1 [Salisediminibacterium halotolerans]TWG36215.1 glycosyl transferase family 1 [Salisediminibacterium halotolerans]GEL08354.1 hypothetical protein SHA02_17700 [Salisediminibacterium halotolerans]
MINLKQTAVRMIEKSIFQWVSSDQKAKMSAYLSENQKQRIRRLLGSGEQRKRMEKIKRLNYKLTTLGFEEKAVADLEDTFSQAEDIELSRLAGYELMQWYENSGDRASRLRSLEIGECLLKLEKDKPQLRRLIIMVSESLLSLDERDTAARTLQKLYDQDKHIDVRYAKANLEQTSHGKLNFINEEYISSNYAPVFFNRDYVKFPLYDQLDASVPSEKVTPYSYGPKVSIIMPAYNAETYINTAIRSIMKQTWRNIELLVVDDCSTDRTKETVQSWVEKDSRITLLQTDRNSGPYAARNIALKVAEGDYITINDSDDWSHPEKIEVQVRHLEKNKRIIGNFSNHARVSNDLSFSRRGKFGIYVFPNFSSLMFRKDKVLEQLGYWDSVRFAGDSEFVARLKASFGEKSLAYLEGPPLSLLRSTEESLTGNSVFGFPGFFMGARQEYDEAHTFYREQGGSLFYDFPQQDRPFPVPEPMKPGRSKEAIRHFDVIIASEFRLTGGTNMTNIEEIKAQKSNGLKTGLVQLSRYDLNKAESMNPHVREWIDGEWVEKIVYGEHVTCDILIVRHPPALEEWQRYVPNIEAKNIHVIINQTPLRDYEEEKHRLYSFDKNLRNLESYFGKKGTWYPIGPRIREILLTEHKEELHDIPLAEKDWLNIINIDEWRRPSDYTREKSIRIGRHSRDQMVKWPEDEEILKQVYPESADFEIRVLGGAKTAKTIMNGSLPKNWTVYQFDELTPKEFLHELDVYVYYTHSGWVEAFGRVIIEAMATGVPVIIEPKYKVLFGEAALYAEPENVEQTVRELMDNPEFYQNQVEKAFNYVEEHFGYTKHISRLKGGNHETIRD